MKFKDIINTYKSTAATKKRFKAEYNLFLDNHKSWSKNSKINISQDMMYEDSVNTSFDRHYTYFPAWAIRKILGFRKSVHDDIGSTISLSTMLSAIMRVNFYDFRPAKIKLSNLVCKHADLTRLKFRNNSIDSLSCLHVIEHVGLGRYGDPIDPDGDKKAASELVRVTSKGGNLLIVVPVGKPKIVFNMHRIYAYDQVIALFSTMKLREFSLIQGSGDSGIIENADPGLVKKEVYGCGCFWFKKV